MDQDRAHPYAHSAVFLMKRSGIDIAALKRHHKAFIAAFEQEVALSLTEAGQDAQDHVRNNSEFERRSQHRSVKDATKAKLIRSKNGKLIRLTNSKMRDGYDVSVGLERGTKAHTIRARGRALRFKSSSGATIFRRAVKHPGTKAYKFLFKASSSAYTALGITLRRRLTALGKRF